MWFCGWGIAAVWCQKGTFPAPKLWNCCNLVPKRGISRTKVVVLLQFGTKKGYFPHQTDLFLGMVLQDVLHPLVGGDVGVDFGGEDAFVTKHLLNNAQVSPIFHQMGSK